MTHTAYTGLVPFTEEGHMARIAEGAASWRETPPFRAVMALLVRGAGPGPGRWLRDEATHRYYPCSPSTLRQLLEDSWLHRRLGYRPSVWGGTWAAIRQGPAYGVTLLSAGLVTAGPGEVATAGGVVGIW